MSSSRRIEHKPRDAFTKTVAAVLVLAVAAFIAVNAYNSAVKPLVISRAAYITTRRELDAPGYIIREEAVLHGSPELSAPEMRDGDRAAAGALVATVYPGGTDETALARVRENKQRIAALRDLAGRGETERARQSDIAVRALADAVARRDLARANELSVTAESLLLAGSDTASPETEVARLEAEIGALTAGLFGGTSLYAPRSGIFTSVTDGFEGVTPEMARGAVPSELRGMFDVPGGDGAGAGAGKLVYGNRWYLAVIVPAPDASAVRERASVRVSIPRVSNADYVMRVENAGRAEGGECVVLLSCTERMTETFSQRGVTAHIVFGEDSGFAVPKEAVRLDEDGTPHIYIAVSQSALRLDIVIIRELGTDAFLVAIRTEYISDGASPELRAELTRARNRNSERAAYLRDGAEIVTRANDLYDGKVIR